MMTDLPPRPPRGAGPASTAMPLAVLAAVAALAVATVPSAGRADEAAAKDAAAATTELAPMTVTARRAEEGARDVPFGLTVISGDDIETRRLNTIEDVLRATPGVSVNSSGGPNLYNLSIRGVGALYQMSMDDASVVLNIDGTALTPHYSGLGTLDVERVEVLKGPQGTLFGGNGEAGAINITTRRPTRHLEGYLRGEYGQENQRLIEGAVGGALAENLSGRVALRHSGSDLWADNLQTGDPLSEPTDLAFRGSLLWEDFDGTSVLATAERQRVENLTNLLVLMPYRDPPVNDLTPGLFDDNEKTMERYALEIAHDFQGARLTATTSVARADFTGLVAYDRLIQAAMGRGGEYWIVDTSEETVLSQDIRLSSLPDADIFWVAGVNLHHADRSYDTPRNTYGTGSATERDFTTRRYAVYGEATVPVAPRLKLTAGLRQAWEEKTYDATYHGGGTAVSDARDLSDAYTTGRLGLSYAVTPETTIYALASRGYNPGGFSDYSTQPADSVPYKPAVNRSIEAGVKTETADRRFQASAALFFNDVKNNHLLSYDPATYVTNAVNADTRSQGAEIEASWRIGGELTLSGGLTLIDTEIRTNLIGPGAGDVRAGNRVPDVPRWAGRFSVAWIHDLPVRFGNLPQPALNVRADYTHVGARTADPQNSFDLAAYDEIDLHLGVMSGGAEVYLWGDNLLDETRDLYGYFSAPATAYGAPARGRTVGVGMAWQF
ncbi:TonB-dependent receptor [Tistrella bauzanensis]|uniref:TonB-dependent receptor n=1 Tax=Tistrella TaxID=171436 RepID=UPI0031F64D56